MSYQGTRFRLGRGQTFFAIWPEGAPLEHPLEQWPATPEGWSAAWSRFNELEPPGSITPFSKSSATAGLKVTNSSALLVIGVVFGVVGLFPAYWTGSSLASQPAELVPHVLYLAAWAVAAGGVLLGGGRARIAALLGLGTSVVTLGLFVADIGQATSGSSADAGLILACIGWGAATAGAVLALRSSWKWRELLAKPHASALGVTVILTLAAIGLAVTFVPGWDSYHLTAAASGQSETVTNANAFSLPWLMVLGNVLVMIAIVAVAVLAGLWRSLRLGAVLMLGAIVPLAAQAISALIQNGEATSPTQFGISPSNASAMGLTISNGLTPWFWLYCVFGVALLISCAWMLLTPARPVPAPMPAGEPAFAASSAAASGAAAPEAPTSPGPATSGPATSEEGPSDTVSFGPEAGSADDAES